MRPRKLGRRSPLGEVGLLATTPWPRFRPLTYQRFDQPVGRGSGVDECCFRASQLSGRAKVLTSPLVSALAWPSSIQKLPYFCSRARPPPAPGGMGGSEPLIGGSCATDRKV